VPEPRPRRPRADAQPNPRADARTPETRAADHAAINRLADELVPALAAKLGATGLGEIEVREGDWRLRVRRPGEGPNLGRRATDRPSRAQPGHAGHGHAPAALEGHRAARPTIAAPHSTNGTSAGASPAVRSEPVEGGRRRKDADPHRSVAKSPAVGIFQPKSGVRPGTRVRAGDRLGVVDMLGVPQDVLAPGDGVVGEALVEAGDAVEFGQDLVVIELMTPARN
jgi:acetyl-CoA carboxylase biotin carboxyl carrier protein